MRVSAALSTALKAHTARMLEVTNNNIGDRNDCYHMLLIRSMGPQGSPQTLRLES